MKNIKQFSKIFLALLFLTSCRSSINDLNPIINSEDHIDKNNNLEKEKLEIKISCGNDNIKKYLDEGWIITKEDSKEKICTWKSVPANKDCDMEKDKGCKITKPDKIGEEKIYLLEK
tara:strand:- start:671 stop:1021 length:351 start_codon:yes stop_codon:yes gene_type:complete